MYDLVMFVSAELKMNKVEVYLEGIYAIDHKDLRHKCDIVAHKFCQALVDLNLDLSTLRQKFSTALFNINPDLILNQMEKHQRLKVINQTRACVDFVHQYFRRGFGNRKWKRFCESFIMNICLKQVKNKNRVLDAKMTLF